MINFELLHHVALLRFTVSQMVIPRLTFAEVMGSLKLTTGPDLPVRPIGPGGPLMASCGHKPKKSKSPQYHQSYTVTGRHLLSLARGGGAMSAFVKDRSERTH